MNKKKITIWIMAVCLGIGLFSFPVLGNTSNENETAGIDTSVIVPASAADQEKQYAIVLSAESKEVIQKIKMDYKGQLKIDIIAKDLPKAVTIELYKNEDCTEKIGSSVFLSTDDLKGKFYVDIPAEGLYYLKFHTYSPVEADVELAMIPISYREEAVFLKSGVWADGFSVDQSLPIFHEISIPKTGYIKVEARAAGSLDSFSNINLYDGGKKVLSRETYLREKTNYAAYFAVKKGTYYISAKCRGDYRIQYTFYTARDKSGASKEKAAVLKKGIQTSGLIYGEDKTTKYDWYKLSLTKKQKITLKAETRANGTVEYKIFPEKSSVKLTKDSYTAAQPGTGTLVTKESLPAGTYYIRVGKTMKTTTGYYRITWK